MSSCNIPGAPLPLAVAPPPTRFLHRRQQRPCWHLVLVLWFVPLQVLLLINSPVMGQQSQLEAALMAEQQGDYPRARGLYQEFLAVSRGAQGTTVVSGVGASSAELSRNGRISRASISLRISVLDEAIRLGNDPAIAQFLTAISYRDNAEYELAIGELEAILEQYPSSFLRDDAQYLMGYIALMDRFEFTRAHEAMRKLLRKYPDTPYFDTALYSAAIALEQLGNTLAARERFIQLRERHSLFSLALLNRSWPKGTVLSRYWFDRADKRLAILDARTSSAAKLTTRRVLGARSRTLRVTVDVEGVSMALLLSPSRLINTTEFLDGENQQIQPPRAQYYTGEVEGEEGSWARVSIEGDAIQGVVQSQGARFVLLPDTLVGTIDYYQSKIRADKRQSESLQDYLMYPPQSTSTPEGEDSGHVEQRSRTDMPKALSSAIPVSRVAQIAIVVDSQYNDYYGGSGLSQAMSVLNVADGIFREEFALALEVVSAKVFSERGQDPMNLGPQVTLEQMLRNFRDYRLQNAATTRQSSLMYLFSGNQNADEAIGLAWIGAVCRSDGYDVGITTPSSYGDLLVTHELGHSLGAQHDSDTACKTDTNRLMWPRISGLTEQEFTHCSRGVLLQGLSNACYLDSIDVSLELTLEGSSQMQIVVTNSDSSRIAEDVRLHIDGTGIVLPSLPGVCEEKGEAEIVCRTGVLLPDTARTLLFELAPLNDTGITLMAEAKPENAADVFSVDNTAQLDIRLGDDGATKVTIASGADLNAENEVEPSGIASVSQSNRGSGATSYGLLLIILLHSRCQLLARNELRIQLRRRELNARFPAQ